MLKSRSAARDKFSLAPPGTPGSTAVHQPERVHHWHGAVEMLSYSKARLDRLERFLRAVARSCYCLGWLEPHVEHHAGARSQVR